MQPRGQAFLRLRDWKKPKMLNKNLLRTSAFYGIVSTVVLASSMPLKAREVESLYLRKTHALALMKSAYNFSPDAQLIDDAVNLCGHATAKLHGLAEAPAAIKACDEAIDRFNPELRSVFEAYLKIQK